MENKDDRNKYILILQISASLYLPLCLTGREDNNQNKEIIKVKTFKFQTITRFSEDKEFI